MLLKEWRWESFIEQVELAITLGVSQSLISRAENGHKSFKLRKRFMKRYGVAETENIEEFKL